MVLAFDEFLHFDVLHDSELGEGLLEDLEVGHELVVELGLPVHLAHRDLAGVEHVSQLAIDSACAQLLDLSQIGFEEFVDPAEQFPSRHFDGVVGVDGYFVDHLLTLL